MRNTILAIAVSALAVPALAADDPYKIKLMLGGGYELGNEAFSQTRSFDLYRETATVTAAYDADSALGLDVGVQWNAFKSIGFQLSGTMYDRDLTASVTGSFPHPLYFDQPRSVEASATGKMKETAGHLNVVLFGKSGSLDLSAWGGVSLFNVEADVVQNVVFTEAYPYDTVTVTGTPAQKAKDSPIGFNVGGSADYRFSKTIGLGVQARFAKAKAKLPGGGGQPDIEVDAGGFQIGGGLRIYF